VDEGSHLFNIVTAEHPKAAFPLFHRSVGEKKNVPTIFLALNNDRAKAEAINPRHNTPLFALYSVVEIVFPLSVVFPINCFLCFLVEKVAHRIELIGKQCEQGGNAVEENGSNPRLTYSPLDIPEMAEKRQQSAAKHSSGDKAQ
jgi:hypothetical protein